jgi:hypothetical protein
MDKVTISVVGAPQELPVLVAFPQGFPPNYEDCQIYAARKGTGKHLKTTVACKVNGLVYRGSDFDEFSSKKDVNKFAVGVYNPVTKELKVVPANHAYVMKPELNSSKITSIEPAAMTNLEKRQSLIEEFGSRKKKKSMQAAISNIISSENISGAVEIEEILSRKSVGNDTSMLADAAHQAMLSLKKAKRSK